MTSEIFRAIVANEDISFIQGLIDSSSSIENLNGLEPNETTALHEACRRKREDVVMLFLFGYKCNYHHRDKDGRTAYDISCEQIRSIFPRHQRDENPFCTNANAVNPLVVPGLDNIDHSTHWIDHPHATTISTEIFRRAVDSHGDAWRGLFQGIGSFLRIINPNEKRKKWAITTLHYIDACISEESCRKNAHQLLLSYFRSNNIEDLFKIYTLHGSFTQYIGQSPERTKHYLSPISDLSYTVEYRSFRGSSYRGVVMNDVALNQYRTVLNKEHRFVQTKTFCSSSIQSEVASLFSSEGQLSPGQNSVLITFNFVQPCSSAIKLYADGPNIPQISHFNEEYEVLIFPQTNFRVSLIDQTSRPGVTFITLDHYNTDEEENEAHQERFESYVNSILLE